MNRRKFLFTGALALTGLTVASRLALAANGKIGNLTPAEFDKANKDGAAEVSAIHATSGGLSEADSQLMMEVAMGGMMQLEMSKLAEKMATDEDVRTFAKGEAAEQTGLAAKLREIAVAKKVSLPQSLDDKGKAMVAKLQGMSGADFNHAYMMHCGVEGHELLLKTMTKVESTATDPTLKQIAMVTLPLIKTHLQAARDEMSDGGMAKKAA